MSSFNSYTIPLDPELATVKLSEVEAKRVDWLWKDRIARGKLTIVAGMPDVNKSTLLLNIAAAVTNGGALPANEGTAANGSVIFLTAEDDLGDTVRPRAEVAGAKLERIEIVTMVKIEAANIKRSFDLMQDLPALERLITKMGDVALVIIDPITAYMGKPAKLDSYRSTDVRSTLMPLHEMCARTNVAVVGISHLNKKGSDKAMLRVLDSVAYVAAPRSAYLVARDEEDEDRRLFLPMKNNNTKVRTGLAFRVIEKLAPPPVFDAYPAIKWEDGVILMTADEALAKKADGRRSESLERAMTMLAEMLADGPKLKNDIEARAAAMGIGEKSLRNAKKEMFIKAEKTGVGAEGQWWWALPGQELPL